MGDACAAKKNFSSLPEITNISTKYFVQSKVHIAESDRAGPRSAIGRAPDS